MATVTYDGRHGRLHAPAIGDCIKLGQPVIVKVFEEQARGRLVFHDCEQTDAVVPQRTVDEWFRPCPRQSDQSGLKNASKLWDRLNHYESPLCARERRGLEKAFGAGEHHK